MMISYHWSNTVGDSQSLFCQYTVWHGFREFSMANLRSNPQQLTSSGSMRPWVMAERKSIFRCMLSRLGARECFSQRMD